MPRIRTQSLAATLVIGVGASLAPAELVTNGGFETGGFFPWSAPPPIPPPNQNAQYFVVSGGGGHSGNYWARLSSSNFQYISQVVPTTAGTDYELTFWLRRTSNFSSPFYIRWEGQFVFQQSILLPDNTNWWPFTVPLHSNFTGSLLEFGQATFPNEFHIDDISVVQVPGPGGAAVFAAACCVECLVRGRRRRGA